MVKHPGMMKRRPSCADASASFSPRQDNVCVFPQLIRLLILNCSQITEPPSGSTVGADCGRRRGESRRGAGPSAGRGFSERIGEVPWEFLCEERAKENRPGDGPALPRG